MVTSLFVFGAMLLALNGLVGLGAGKASQPFEGTWTLLGASRDGGAISQSADGTMLELRGDGTAACEPGDVAFELMPHASDMATWSADTPGVGMLSMGPSTYLMSLDGSRLVIDAAGSTLVFSRSE